MNNDVSIDITKLLRQRFTISWKPQKRLANVGLKLKYAMLIFRKTGFWVVSQLKPSECCLRCGIGIAHFQMPLFSFYVQTNIDSVFLRSVGQFVAGLGCELNWMLVWSTCLMIFSQWLLQRSLSTKLYAKPFTCNRRQPCPLPINNYEFLFGCNHVAKSLESIFVAAIWIAYTCWAHIDCEKRLMNLAGRVLGVWRFG